MAAGGRGLLRTSFASYFMLPEQGMARPELLSRTGCTVLSGRQRPGSLVLATSSHVAAPFRWPRYYAGVDWLPFVRPESVSYLLELRDARGKVLEAVPLDPASLCHHRERDICVVAVPEGARDALRARAEASGEPADGVLEACLPSAALDNWDRLRSEKLLVRGFEVVDLADEAGGDGGDGGMAAGGEGEAASTAGGQDGGGEGGAGEDDGRPLLPLDVEARVVGARPGTLFAESALELPFGMCGSPVLDAGGGLVGVVEGVIQAPGSDAQVTAEQREALEKLAGLAQLSGLDVVEEVLDESGL